MQGVTKLAEYAASIGSSQLVEFMAEDAIGGVDSGWPVGSIFGAEGQLIYAAVRALQPKWVIEIGTHFGCSATHILAALQRNQHGRLISLDINAKAGSLIPEVLRERWSLIAGDALAWLSKADLAPGAIIFEDGPHSFEFTEKALDLAGRLRPRLLLGHDTLHAGVGKDVRGAWTKLFGNTFSDILIPPSDCGLAWRRF